ncbi:hypothetical protein WALSEDRAFT_62332 [Wallemia mellicola CBS 633.66]|uniref:Uncharacterized protein n=1 Tax=Wallemia mellicola (strain ATCC MYA-4683 / CBS 633.66) TaxID=671144 RepID=I4YI73_WALMC|nr:hypothetical protein WALSEDRAFT_62332 [Wallemia mellicola CBS 633.66]EIM23665.1 hypothetical protein WALSEDRAFT_62332 [Wallemia mellicola CBS 633.66]|eukprot:XP_006956332.1 hypothetical protein WALSEDRAFT_62332 [Wallemia mellicola CBS 633.66]
MQFKYLISVAVLLTLTVALPAEGKDGEFQFAGTSGTRANNGDFKGKSGKLL